MSLLRMWKASAVLVWLMFLAGCSSMVAVAPEYPDGELSPLKQTRVTSATKVSALQPPTDLWTRMRAGFAMPDLETDLVDDRTRWYVERPDGLERMMQRSNKYLFHIVEELERRNMPTELALLPFIESAYNPAAVSSAKAAGMWQFMPATGTYFDLHQNAFRDDRRDVLASTRAALDYLEKLYDMFGDWHLALAAYNWGEGSVGRARAKNQNMGLPVGYTDLTMPEETRMYVPKFQAIKNIVRNPQAYGLVLPDIGNHAYFDSVELHRDMDVALVAQLAGITEADFRLLNPSYRGPVIFAAATDEVLLPWDNAQTFKRNLAERRTGRLASWTVWTAPRTMQVAEVAKSLGVAEEDIVSANQIPKGMAVTSGSALIVPRSTNTLYDVAAEVAHSGQLKLTPNRASQTRRVNVVARKGETVATLARRYRVSADDVASWNQVGRTAKFKTGQRLVIYQAATTTTAKTASTAARKTNNKKSAPAKRSAKK